MVVAQKQIYRSMEQNRNPEMDPQLYDQLICNKAGSIIQWKNDNPFNKECWENWTATCKRMKLGQFLTPYTKINSKWMEDPNGRQETTKILEENTGIKLFDLSCSNFSLGISPEARETKTKMNY